MGKNIDIAALGELLIDFTEAGTGADGMRLFEQNPGGAPANLLTLPVIWAIVPSLSEKLEKICMVLF